MAERPHARHAASCAMGGSRSETPSRRLRLPLRLWPVPGSSADRSRGSSGGSSRSPSIVTRTTWRAAWARPRRRGATEPEERGNEEAATIHGESIEALRFSAHALAQMPCSIVTEPCPCSTSSAALVYRCRHSGVCCNEDWDIPVDAPTARAAERRSRRRPLAAGARRRDDFEPRDGLPSGDEPVVSDGWAANACFSSPVADVCAPFMRQLGHDAACPRRASTFPVS